MTLEHMKKAKRWLVWDDKKIPYYLNGSRRSGALDTPSDWLHMATYEEAVKVYRGSQGRFAGIGFALGPDETGRYWQGIDLDKIEQNGLSDLVTKLPGYVEYSPSGKGVHAIGYGKDFLALGNNSSGIEAYAHGRYFTFTGDEIRNGNLVCLAEFVEQTLAPVHRQAQGEKMVGGGSMTQQVTPAAVIIDSKTVSELRSALLYMRSDDYGLWIKIGHALHELGDRGRGLWMEWSAISDKFDPKEAAKKWGSFKPENTGYQAVFAEAQRQGWLNPNSNAARLSVPVSADKKATSEKIDGYDSQVIIQHATDIHIKPTNWLWDGWLPYGKLTILAGQAGTGKTTLALAIAAAITTKVPFPDGSEASTHGNVLIWSGEDAADDTLLPRLLASGADPKRLFFVQGVLGANGERLPFDPSKDIPKLKEAASRIDGGISLLIVDPIVNAVSGDSHKANDVRRNLQPLVDFGEQQSCAVLGITHFSKGSVGKATQDRIIGSQAFVAVARIVWVVAKEEGTDRCVLVRAKSNIGPDDGGFGYEIRQELIESGHMASRVIWGDPIEGTSREILAQVEYVDDGGSSALEEAKQFLLNTLVNCPTPTNQLKDAAKEVDISWRAIERAKKSIGIETERRGELGKKGGGIWYWKLPENALKNTNY